MIGKTKKATFNLHTDVLAALDEMMVKGKAPSKNALVEQALIKELQELRRQTRAMPAKYWFPLTPLSGTMARRRNGARAEKYRWKAM